MRFSWSCFFLFLSFALVAQIDHESVFSDLDDEALRQALVDNYKTSTVLTYSEARDTFMKNIDAVDNVLECVYTGYKITLSPNEDPTTEAFDKGINTEHTYPRSKGANENTNAFSDMHHLFPTRIQVNSDRGSLPLSEVADNQTDKWYFEDNTITSIPSQGIDNYSELLQNVSFEPREQHKGDVARAYFYFYTMYQSQADQAAPNFFESQRETMCQWHFDDPVDEKEWNRNIKISEYQDGKKNPFILDCKLARLYCDEILGSCISVSTDEVEKANIQIRPNPVQEMLYLDIDSEYVDRFSIINLEGREVHEGWIEKDVKNTAISLNGMNNGFYIVYVYNTVGQVVAVSKFIKI